MRYRPFTRFGLSASAITLVLDDARLREADRISLLRTALEAGVNSFELATSDPEVARTLGDAISAVGRRTLVLSLCVGRGADAPDFSSDGLKAAVAAALEHTGAERFDVVMLDEPDAGALLPEAIDTLEQVRQHGGARLIGLSGGGAATDTYMAARSFDLLATPFSMKSGWPERNRINAAIARGMTILGYDYGLEPPRRVVEPQRKGLARLFHRPGAAREHAYDFLHHTPNWTADEIALAYALTEPSLASVRVRACPAQVLEGLAAAVERELPAGVAAQIEMARFAEVA